MLAYKTKILNSNPVRSFGLVSSAEEHDSYESNVENVLKARHAEAVLITLSCRGYLQTPFSIIRILFSTPCIFLMNVAIPAKGVRISMRELNAKRSRLARICYTRFQS